MKKIISYICVAASLGLGAFGWFRLPDRVVMQIGLDGTPTQTGPKLLLLLIPSAIAVAGAFISSSNDDNESGTKGLVLSLCGVAIMVFSIGVNLRLNV